jgi:hypothetical protein
MKNPTAWFFALLALVGAAAIVYVQWLRHASDVPAPGKTEAPAPAPRAPPEPAIRYPVAEPAEAKPLPQLGESDGSLKEALAELVGQKPFAEFFYPGDIIRRIVATVDNLPREKAALRLMPVKPVAGKFLTIGEDDRLVIAADNYQRYALHMQLLEALDMQKMVAIYTRFYPLFQQAYKELGYPKGYFNDRVVEVIDHLLATPNPTGPVKLTRPKVFYEFADSKLEKLSAGQKIMLRIGPENAAKVKAKLTEIRQALTTSAIKQ